MKRQNPLNNKITPEEEESIRKNMEKTPITKKDFWALTIAMLITVMPIVLLTLGAFVLLIWLLFLR